MSTGHRAGFAAPGQVAHAGLWRTVGRPPLAASLAPAVVGRALAAVQSRGSVTGERVGDLHYRIEVTRWQAGTLEAMNPFRDAVIPRTPPGSIGGSTDGALRFLAVLFTITNVGIVHASASGVDSGGLGFPLVALANPRVVHPAAGRTTGLPCEARAVSSLFSDHGSVCTEPFWEQLGLWSSGGARHCWLAARASEGVPPAGNDHGRGLPPRAEHEPRRGRGFVDGVGPDRGAGTDAGSHVANVPGGTGRMRRVRTDAPARA